MASWEPNPDGVREICQLLHEYLQPGVDQQAIFMQLQKCSQYPDFNNYLTYILTHADVRIRVGSSWHSLGPRKTYWWRIVNALSHINHCQVTLLVTSCPHCNCNGLMKPTCS